MYINDSLLSVDIPYCFQVLCVIFQYVAMLRKSGPQERIFKELHLTEKIEFEYVEESNTIDNVEDVSEVMQLYPPTGLLERK